MTLWHDVTLLQVPGGGGDRGRPWGRMLLSTKTASDNTGPRGVPNQGLAAWVGR